MSQKKTTFKPLFRDAAGGGFTMFESEVIGNEIHRFNTKIPLGYDIKVGKIKTSNGYLTPKKQPKRQEMSILYGKSKNEGKANEVTPEEDAIRHLENERKKKIDTGFTEKEPDVVIVEGKTTKKAKGAPKSKKINARSLNPVKNPMLLHRYDKKELPDDKITVSVKYNGLRGLYKVETDNIVSRKGLPYHHLEHLLPVLKKIADLAEEDLIEKGYRPRDGTIKIIEAVDFEIDVPNEVCVLLQDKVSVIKSAESSIPDKNIDKVIARVFDLADRAIVPFKDRYLALKAAYTKLSKKEKEKVPLVACYQTDDDSNMINSLEEFNSLYSFCSFLADYEEKKFEREPVGPLSKGDLEKWRKQKKDITVADRIRLLHRWITDILKEEGTVLRTASGLYEANEARSSNVLKYKDFEDEEAVIVGAAEGKGAKSGSIIFQLRSLVNKSYYSSVFAEECGIDIPKARIMWKEWNKDNSSYYGKVVTVRMQERYDSGVPQFPGIVCFRSEKDCPYNKKQIEEVLKYHRENPPKKVARKKDSSRKTPKKNKGKKKVSEVEDDE